MEEGGVTLLEQNKLAGVAKQNLNSVRVCVGGGGGANCWFSLKLYSIKHLGLSPALLFTSLPSTTFGLTNYASFFTIYVHYR